MTSTAAPLRFIALAGPTATGKTAAALALVAHAKAIGGPLIEIVSVDSALVYRGMDIGTAKPCAAELALAPHHLIDIRDPAQPYSAGEFVADAQALIDAITARGALPLLVGGTMMYFKALIDGMDELPMADPAIRSELDARAQLIGWPALHAQLAQVDPVTAARLAPNDAQRIQRALEVWQSSGQTLSSLHLRTQRTNSQAEVSRDHVSMSLEPQSRNWLHERIEQRFDAMLAAGLIDEVRRLRERGDLNADLPSMRCVGYRQCWQWLDEQDESPRALARLREQGVAATRQLAKRQLTWLRSLPQRYPLACDQGDPAERFCQALTPLLRAWPQARADMLKLDEDNAVALASANRSANARPSTVCQP
jgi:tRNA dimethylallyltransferase